jgi:hypothetical protein
MTHDELLAICDNYSFKDSAEPVKALRAVVELAGKDIKHESYVWLDGYDYAMKQIIQAIEKELA